MSLVRCPHSSGCIHYVYCRGVGGRRCCLKGQNVLRPNTHTHTNTHTQTHTPHSIHNFFHEPPFPLFTKRKNHTLHFILSEIQISRKEEMELDSPLPIILGQITSSNITSTREKISKKE